MHTTTQKPNSNGAGHFPLSLLSGLLLSLLGCLLGFLLLFLLPLSLHAENYPYRSDFLWVTNPDHADWLYKTGEDATVEVQLYKYGVKVNGEIQYEIAPDMLDATSKGTAKLNNGVARIKIGTRKTPGFQDLRLTAVVDGMKTQHHVKVGYGVNDIKPYTQMPDDFNAFWQRTIDEMHKTPLKFTREYVPEMSDDKIDCWLIKLQIDRTHCMYGYLTMPKNAKAGSHPAVLCPPGAGVKTIKEPLSRRYYAENGFIRLEVEIHGIDPRLTNDQFRELQNAFGDYLTIGIDSPERYYMRHVYAGMVRCLDFLTSLPEWDHKKLAVQGGSQGGALALVTAGLDSRVTHCVANHPALTDMAAYAEKGRTGGYPHMHKSNLLNNADGTPNRQNIRTLQYFDVINFCRQVTCPVRLTWGYNDSTCPPTTSYAAWNTLQCPKQCVITPINEHWTSTTMEQQHMEWLRE